MTNRAIILTLLFAVVLTAGSVAPAFASAQMDIKMISDTKQTIGDFKYQRAMFITYDEGGQVADLLKGKEHRIEFYADASTPGMDTFMQKLNQYNLSRDSTAVVTDLELYYLATMKGRDLNASFDYKIVISPNVENAFIRDFSPGSPALADVNWRGMGALGPVVITTEEYGDVEINIPASFISTVEPELAQMLQGTDAQVELEKRLINADGIRDQPMDNWHFLFDPTGINVDASQWKLSDEIAGKVISSYTMGESSIREGRQVETVVKTSFTVDKEYGFSTFEATDNANLDIIGFAIREVQGNSEIMGISPEPPEGFSTSSTGEFPAMIIYGMAGAAAAGGIGLFMVSSRKAAAQDKIGYEQTGIDPSHLVGRQTSASSGGYQTTRGEAQLAGDVDYDQHRSVYEENVQQQSETPAIETSEEATCGCAGSAEMGSECDCAMQGACLCDASCNCSTDVCRDNVSSMS